MVTTNKATAKRVSAKKNASKARKTTTVRTSADKAVNVYLGLIGKGLDLVQENIESARKSGKKRVSALEKRGMKLRNSLTRRVKSIDVPDSDHLARKAKVKINKAQSQIEDVVEDVVDTLKGKQAAAPKRRTTTRKAA